MKEQMNSDQDLLNGAKRLKEISLSHSRNEHDNDEIEEALLILRNISIYVYKVNSERSVQLSQVEDNITNVRRTLNQPAVEGHYPNVSHSIDNLVTYCGA